MARHEQDREDLLGEATALVERIELDVDDLEESVVVGFRKNGAVSCFFGAEPVYQFNSDGLLRRAYAAGRLIKAEQGRLVALDRQRSEGQLALVRDSWDDATIRVFVNDAADELARLRDALEQARFRIIGQVPDDADVARRVREWLATLPETILIADSAGVH